MSYLAFEGKHIHIIRYEMYLDKPCFVVLNKHDDFELGRIAWFPKWKKYSFYPNSETVYEWHCLRDISTFMETETVREKAKK